LSVLLLFAKQIKSSGNVESSIDIHEM